jgi:adenylate cyclase
MGKEIERKFLLADEGWREQVQRSRRMSQGYLADGGRASVRVRVAGDEAWLNVKAAGLVAERDEYEYSIPVEDAREMLGRLARPPLIDKTRHWVAHAGMQWEIDEFHGDNAGLIVAEIELEQVGQAFELPPWLGTEVTHLARYYNVNLGRAPYRDWSAAERIP